jgi:hypothetical protein
MSESSKKPRPRKGYSIGYGKPPVRHRFQPGKSGNPRGRPKVAPTLPELAARELARRRFIVVEGKRVSIRTDELLIRNMIAMAGKGQGSTANVLFQWAGVQHEKERRKNIEVRRIHAKMNPQEALDAFLHTMAQPSSYDLDERL